MFIEGLQDIALEELSTCKNLQILEQDKDELTCESSEPFSNFKNLKSVANVCLVKKDKELNPYFLSNHKSILGKMIEKILQESSEPFRSFKISCAGSDSNEIQSLKTYITETYKMIETDDADLIIAIGISGETP